MAAPGPAQAAGGVARGGPVRPSEPGWLRPSGLSPAQERPGAPEPGRREAGALAALLNSGLDTLRLPEPMELVSALRAAETRVALADRAAPGLAALVRLVIAEEIARLDRYLDMRGQ